MSRGAQAERRSARRALGERPLLWLICGPGLLYLALWALIALSRCSFPSELEWMEGGMIAHAVRLAEGEAIYAPPSLDFVPFFYTPGYPALLWLLSALTGSLSFTLARSISIASTLGLMALIYHSVLRERGAQRGAHHAKPQRLDHLYALLGVGVYAGLYRTCGAFYDVARPDALTALLTGGVLYLGRFGLGARGALTAACLMSLAFFTKQTASVFYPAVGLYWLTRSWRDGLTYLLTTLALCAGGCYLLNVQSDGVFWSYIFEGHQGHLFYWKNILLRYWRDLIFLAPITLLIPWLWFRQLSPSRLLPTLLLGWWLAALIQRALSLDYPPHMYYRELWYEGLLSGRLAILIPPLLMISAAAFIKTQRPARPSPPASSEGGAPSMSGYWLWVYIAGAGASALNHSTQWAYSNCFMPLSLACALCLPHMVSDLRSAGGRATSWALLMIFSLQWTAWLYAPSEQLPTAADSAALAQLKAKLTHSAQGGRALSPAAPLLPYQLGLGPVSTHQMGIVDVAYRGGVEGLERLLRREWALVVTHEQSRVPRLTEGYFEAERLWYLSERSLRAKTGFLTRPQSLWLPRHHSGARALPGPQPVSANFEAPDRWEALGWLAEGEAFGARPQRLRGAGREGDYAAVSSRGGRGSLKATLNQPKGEPEHIALSALVHTPNSRRARDPKLSMSLHSRGGALIARVRVSATSPRRLLLKLTRLSSVARDERWPLTLTVQDDDPSHGLWIDDLRWQTPLDAPLPPPN